MTATKCKPVGKRWNHWSFVIVIYSYASKEKIIPQRRASLEQLVWKLQPRQAFKHQKDPDNNVST